VTSIEGSQGEEAARFTEMTASAPNMLAFVTLSEFITMSLCNYSKLAFGRRAKHLCESSRSISF
jgi:hypothetical protein